MTNEEARKRAEERANSDPRGTGFSVDICRQAWISGYTAALLEDGDVKVHERLDALRKLEPDWDSYGGPRIDERAIVTAEAILTTSPSITPTSHNPQGGGVQIEWHCGGINHEIVINPDGTLEEDEARSGLQTRMVVINPDGTLEEK